MIQIYFFICTAVMMIALSVGLICGFAIMRIWPEVTDGIIYLSIGAITLMATLIAAWLINFFKKKGLIKIELIEYKKEEKEKMKKDRVAAMCAIGIIVLLIALTGGVFSFLAYENYANVEIKLPISFLQTYTRIILCSSFLILVAMTIYTNRRKIKHFLLCAEAWISRRWRHPFRSGNFKRT